MKKVSTSTIDKKLIFQVNCRALKIMIQDLIKHHGPFPDDVVCQAMVDVLQERLDEILDEIEKAKKT